MSATRDRIHDLEDRLAERQRDRSCAIFESPTADGLEEQINDWIEQRTFDEDLRIESVNYSNERGFGDGEWWAHYSALILCSRAPVAEEPKARAVPDIMRR